MKKFFIPLGRWPSFLWDFRDGFESLFWRHEQSGNRLINNGNEDYWLAVLHGWRCKMIRFTCVTTSIMSRQTRRHAPDQISNNIFFCIATFSESAGKNNRVNGPHGMSVWYHSCDLHWINLHRRELKKSARVMRDYSNFLFATCAHIFTLEWGS